MEGNDEKGGGAGKKEGEEGRKDGKPLTLNPNTFHPLSLFRTYRKHEPIIRYCSDLAHTQVSCNKMLREGAEGYCIAEVVSCKWRCIIMMIMMIIRGDIIIFILL